MTYCDEIRSRLAFLLDNELSDTEKSLVEAHLRKCSVCFAAFENERRFLDDVRGSRPFFTATDELRSRVETLLKDRMTRPFATPPALRRRIQHYLWGGSGISRNRKMVAVCSALLVLASGVWFFATKPAKRSSGSLSEFAMMAIDTHQRHVQGKLPLEITSDSPEEISDWFVDKVPFGLKLPNYQESSGQDKLYRLEGARLVAFRNDYAAHVAYQMQNRPITLVVTSDSVAMPWGGEEVASKGLVFHCDSVDGLKVITWSDRGLTYALVSDLEERGQQSCVVCHQGATDRDFIESLKPKGF
jgi:anti-sigma factor RsiW